MSLVFRKTKVQTKPNVNPPIGHKSIKYVELFGTLTSGSLGAGLSDYIIEYTVPNGHCAELYAIGVQPDIDAGATTSNAKELEICYDNKGTGIKFLINHMGKNFLPYGDADSLQPIRQLDFPMRPGNLTVKFNAGMTIQLKVTAKGALQSDMYARAKVLLYEPQDVAAVYGSTISNFATLPGGVQQAMPVMLFTDYVENVSTSTRSRWEVAYTREVEDFEQITLTHIGVVPDANADAAKLYDTRLKWEAPEYEPYWKITQGINALTFGDDAEYQPTYKIPSVIADHVYTNTDMQVQFRDNGSAQSTISLQLLGVYKRVR
jgi:hypothetical protein